MRDNSAVTLSPDTQVKAKATSAVLASGQDKRLETTAAFSVRTAANGGEESESASPLNLSAHKQRVGTAGYNGK